MRAMVCSTSTERTMTRFTRSTYRKARRAAIANLCDAQDFYKYACRKYGDTTLRHPTTLWAFALYRQAVGRANGVVMRGRRERDMWT